MKRAILVMATIGIAMSSLAQSVTKQEVKKDTTVKAVADAPKVYAPNPNRMYRVELNLTETQIYALTTSARGKFDAKYTTDQVDAIKDEAKYVCHVIEDEWQYEKGQDYEKWKADTAKVKLVTKVKKTK